MGQTSSTLSIGMTFSHSVYSETDPLIIICFDERKFEIVRMAELCMGKVECSAQSNGRNMLENKLYMVIIVPLQDHSSKK